MQQKPEFFSQPKLYEHLGNFSKPDLRIKIPIEKDEKPEQKLSPVMALLSYFNCFVYKENNE
jgi:ethanolamine utilization protein EutP (predicted NTPase)